jgi:hypothetical protein
VADVTCQHREYMADDLARNDGFSTGAICGKPARWANCDPLGMPACDDHVCRCRIPLGPYDQKPLQYGEDRRSRAMADTDEKKPCEHRKVYDNAVLATWPVQRRWICELCLETGIDVVPKPKGLSYADLMARRKVEKKDG